MAYLALFVLFKAFQHVLLDGQTQASLAQTTSTSPLGTKFTSLNGMSLNGKIHKHKPQRHKLVKHKSQRLRMPVWQSKPERRS